MGQTQSTLMKSGYKIEKESESHAVVTKDGEKFCIRKLQISTNAELISQLETLKTTSHPHVMSIANSFQDEDQHIYYVVTEYCQGGSLAEKIKLKRGPEQEFEVLSWIAEICMALRFLHEKELLHKNLTPQNIFFTEFETLCLSGFGETQANDTNVSTAGDEAINYLAPEVFTQATYETKSDIWSVGCILYELCTQQLAFSSDTTVSLIPKIICGPYPSLEGQWSPEFCELLSDIWTSDPDSRPTASEILRHPIILRCLYKKSKTTVEHLQTQLGKLTSVADSLERVHQGATIGSLTGGVIGAMGGITSIVGLVLAPFTLGASLVVTGVGVGVGVAGGLTAGASNITNMVNQSSDRKTVGSIIKEFDAKISAVALWLQEISISLQTIGTCYEGDTPDDEESPRNQATGTGNWVRFGTRVGRGLGAITELFRLVRVANIGKIAAQASRAVRVAEVATGVLSGLFVAADIFFIAMDAKEIHNIRQTQEDGTTNSEIMKFVQSIRHAATELQEVLDEFKAVISDVPFLENERELEWDHMEGM
ncbi:calcium/calmodulin-dependent protein kinase type 1D-like [Acanthopagrus latus]|uniref:calcium/calmodulin-dependent protein kinase type 1D-like n=1 Tax=Acanthopagrus latus TaxID=8177 RepID=UPI00187C0B47|nr:calcium/calmodulin-dependent protein kinase type 1D-like [Acanthopagrus latus]XP_036934129.1 calcium/calmodulin-dependent protein kinase type 1D-like [Acanthopagrus latus]XP_036934130.1 calcium/calmodulin-dependent protein kinase type 1D-like [Acanthopagrus latus]